LVGSGKPDHQTALSLAVGLISPPGGPLKIDFDRH
jgi:hypothetical protein